MLATVAAAAFFSLSGGTSAGEPTVLAKYDHRDCSLRRIAVRAFGSMRVASYAGRDVWRFRP